ncbi:MAG TPA: hypothetical protein VHO24_10930 [Opitutaceae bacterium]|nr:hypothetical protein [Opitutaceae bacterium]
MKNVFAVFALAALSLFAGCFPVWKTTDHSEWQGPKLDDGTHVAIQGRRSQRYLRILLTPEGPKDSPRGKGRYRYFIGKNKGEATRWSDLVELPWLALEVESVNRWGEMAALNGTPYWYAIRDVTRATPWSKFEIIVFSRTGVKNRRTITSESEPRFVDDSPPAGKDQPRRTIGWGETPRTLEVEYDSPTGRRRYHLVDDLDGLIDSAGKRVAPDLNVPPLHIEIPAGNR